MDFQSLFNDRAFELSDFQDFTVGWCSVGAYGAAPLVALELG